MWYAEIRTISLLVWTDIRATIGTSAHNTAINIRQGTLTVFPFIVMPALPRQEYRKNCCGIC